MSVRKIGVDPGFGNFKVAATGPEGPRMVLIPSVVGVGDTELGLLSLGKLGHHRRGARPDKVTWNGVSYLAGHNLARYTRPVQRMDFLRFFSGPEFQVLFYASAFRLLGGGNHKLALMVGLPVELMANREKAVEILKGMRGWLVGKHRFSVNGIEMSLEVCEVQVMAQPAGAFFAWGLDDSGKWVRDKEALMVPVGICDIGFNTLDLFAVQGGEVVVRFTGGDTIGIRRAAELLINSVRGQYGVELSLYEADRLLHERCPRIYTAGREVDLRPLVNQAIETAAAVLLAFIEQKWGNGRQFAHLLFTGGGAETLRETLLRHYPHGVVLPNAVMANAVGLARYALRAFKGI